MIDFSAPADVVAPKLLGCFLSHNGVTLRITEVEAYLGTDDPAAHGYRGKTARNAAMFGPPGRFYVYLSYGIHLNGNVVCAPEGTGHGCLLRAGEVMHGEELAQKRRQAPRKGVRGGRPAERDIEFANLARGPGNLGAALDLTLADNGVPVRVTDRAHEPEWVAGPRIGISKNANATLRFWIPGDPTVSPPRGRPKPQADR